MRATSPALTLIKVVNNNGAYVTATQTGAGRIAIIYNGAGVTTTQTGNGVMTINNSNSGSALSSRHMSPPPPTLSRGWDSSFSGG
jgi:hypothetical protein